MRAWGWLFAVLGWLLCALVGLMALLVAVEPEAGPLFLQLRGQHLWTALLGRLPSTGYPAAYWVLGVSLLLIASLTVVVPLLRWRHRRHLTFPGERGAVLVDLATIEDCLRKVLAEEAGVGRARVSLGTRRGHLACEVTVWLEAGSDAVGRLRQMQSRLEEYYAYVLPEGQPLKVIIRARLIYQQPPARTLSARPAASPAGAAKGEGRSDDYYGGPRYPVDSGDADASGLTSS
jgi:hypothetical protein